MSEKIVVQPDTRAALEEVAEEFARRTDYCYPEFARRVIRVGTTLSELRRQLIKANELVAQFQLQNERPIFRSETPDDWSWLTYTVDVDVIPIYEDGVTVSYSKLISAPSEVPYLCRFLTAIGTNNGVDIENHNFGYHFHFGNIKRKKLHRTNLLLTFRPTDPHGPNVPLYAEKHGKYTPIDVAAIGTNKRRPIYDVCHVEMSKKGIANFKKPANGSSVFYP